MKRYAAVFVLLLALPTTVAAWTTEDWVALVSMPLAVAAVADITGVPTHDLIDVVSAMNRASVPPPQFIEVVRYVPVALVEHREPRFTTYVTREVDRGIQGRQLAVSMANQLDAYGVREINVVNPPVRVVERNYVPPMVITRVEARRIDPLALVAMPLAVAAVADITGVPRNDLFGLIASLNRAAVPPPQFIEIVRYSPVVLADPRLQPEFIAFIDDSVDRGLTGIPLALVIDERFRTYGVDDIRVMHPVEPVRVIERDFIPTTVVRRVAEVRGHPHGGPPGQVKRDLGLQTGAEVVHGRHPGRSGVTGRAQAPGRTAEVRGPARSDGDRAGGVRQEPRGKGQKARSESRPNNQPSARAESNRGQGKGKPASPNVRKERSLPPPQTSASPASEERGRGQGKGAAAKGGGSAESPGKGKGKGKGGQ